MELEKRKMCGLNCKIINNEYLIKLEESTSRPTLEIFEYAFRFRSTLNTRLKALGLGNTSKVRNRVFKLLIQIFSTVKFNHLLNVVPFPKVILSKPFNKINHSHPNTRRT